VVRCAALVASALACASLPTPARAEDDPIDEIEIRLKTADVPEHLRKRIHETIQRGVEFLLEHQGRSGRIKSKGDGRDDVAETTIGGLALAHSGGADARRGADLAIDWLIDEKGNTRMAAMTQSYHIGLLGMLLKARDRHPKVAEQIIRQIVAGQDSRTAWWGYGVGNGERGVPFGGGADAPNLSTAQFAALGLWSASKQIGRTPRSAWRAHLESLLRLQTESGSWPYGPRGGMAAGYPNGTTMGLANLLLARAAIEKELPYDPLLRARVEFARRKAMTALNDAARHVLGGNPAKISLAWYYYSIYALEKACVFADADSLDGLRWYITGAQQLIALQHDDGGWGQGPQGKGRDAFRPRGGTNVLDTSFALLFLLRVSETYRPTTPREVPRPAAAVTGAGAPNSPSARAEDPEPPAHVTVTRATELADRLYRLLKDDTTKTRHFVEAVEEAGHALTVLVPDLDRDEPTPEQREADDAAIAAVRDRIERALLATYENFDGPGEDAAERVAVAAANALAHARPAAVDDLRRFVSKSTRGKRSTFPSMARLIAAMRTIAVASRAEHVQWLAALVGTEITPRTVRRSRAALVALGAVRTAPGDERFLAVRSLVRQLTTLEERATRPGEDVQGLTSDYHWEALAAPALIAVTNLARDARTGDEPALESGMPPMSFAELEQWMKSHGDRRTSPWLDAD
jgi:hypothetical protein